MKKGLLITIIIVFILLIGAIIGYYFFYLDKGGTTDQNVPGGGLPNLPPPSPGEGGDRPEILPSGTGETGKKELPRLRELSREPVAGATVIALKANEDKAPIVRFVERATGHIFDAPTDSLEINRISNTTIPKIYEAKFAEGGGAVILRYLKNNDSIESYYAKLVPDSADGGSSSEEKGSGNSITLQGAFLPRDIPILSASPSGSKIFYLYKTSDGSLGIIANPDGTKKNQIWGSPLSEWLSEFADESTITLETKPSSGSFGFVYLLNTKSGAVTKVLGGKIGLTALVSPDKKRALYAEAAGGALKTGIYDIGKATTAAFPFNTLPEKCVWSVKSPGLVYCAAPKTIPVAAYPDSWYQGLTSFSDDIWSVDLNTGATVEVLGDTLKKGVEMDITELKLSPDGTQLIFINKKNLSLWLLRLD